MSKLTPTRLRFDVPLGAVVGSASVRLARRSGVVLRLEDEEGHAGLGEATPLPGYSDESLDQAAAELRRLAGSRSLRPCESPEEVAQLVAASGLETPSARCALESALLDLGARRKRQSVHAFLTGSTRMRVAMNALVHLDDEDEAYAAARAALDEGFKVLKAKVGRPGRFEQELHVLGMLRRRLGDEVEIRLDANGAWSLREAPAHLHALAPIAPAFVEQPVPSRDLAVLSESPLPIAADESARRPEVLADCLARKRIEVLVLKPMVLGGLLPCLALAEQARSNGVRCVVTHLFSGPVAHAGATELALALPEEPLACGLASHPVLLAMGLPPQIAQGGAEARALARPGLGVGSSEQARR